MKKRASLLLLVIALTASLLTSCARVERFICDDTLRNAITAEFKKQAKSYDFTCTCSATVTGGARTEFQFAIDMQNGKTLVGGWGASSPDWQNNIISKAEELSKALEGAIRDTRAESPQVGPTITPAPLTLEQRREEKDRREKIHRDLTDPGGRPRP